MVTGHELDWDDLRYFLHAAQAGSLAGGARALHVEHTTVGRRLAALESALGAPLVLRGPDGLQLTPLGARVLPLAEQVERSVQALRELVTLQRSRVRLAVPSGFASFFAAALAQLSSRHAALTLEIVSGARLVDLRTGEADLAVRSGPVADPELIARKLCDVGWSLYAAPAYLARHRAPRSPDDLTDHDVLAYDASLHAQPAAQWIEARADAARVVLRSRELVDMLGAARAGVGLALLPCILADQEPALCRLTPRVLVTRALSLVYRREARAQKELRAVRRFVVDVLRAHQTSLRGESSKL